MWSRKLVSVLAGLAFSVALSACVEESEDEDSGCGLQCLVDPSAKCVTTHDRATGKLAAMCMPICDGSALCCTEIDGEARKVPESWCKGTFRAMVPKVVETP